MKYLLVPALLIPLAACSSTTTTTNTVHTPPPSFTAIGTAAKNTNGTYQLTQGTQTLNLPAPTQTIGTVNGTAIDSWNSSSGYTGFAYSTANVTAASVFSTGGTYFSGISGTTTPIVSNTTANMTGRYGVIVGGTTISAGLSLTADFAAGTLTDTSPTIAVNGTISGGDVTGTVSYLGFTGNMKGGFYNGIAGGVTIAVLGNNMTGLLVAK